MQMIVHRSSLLTSTHTGRHLRHGVRCYKSSSSPQATQQHGSASNHIAWHTTPSQEPALLAEHLDAIVVLAGGQTETGSGLPPWAERRLDASADLQRLQARPCPIVCLGGGTPHKPPILRPSKHVYHESTACADYLMHRHKVPAAAILKEMSSYDTVGNAFFSMVIHAIPASWHSLAVVTSDFHMPRTKALFEDMYRLAGQDLYNDPSRFKFFFVPVTDRGLFDPAVLEIRKAKEAASLVRWKADVATIGSLKELHAWLHSTHQCYSVARQHEQDKTTIIDKRLLASY